MFRKSDLFILSAVFISFVFSVTLWFTGSKDAGVFVGIWVPSIIGVGAYLKLMVLDRRHERN